MTLLNRVLLVQTAALLGITRLDAYGDSQLVIRQVVQLLSVCSCWPITPFAC